MLLLLPSSPPLAALPPAACRRRAPARLRGRPARSSADDPPPPQRAPLVLGMDAGGEADWRELDAKVNKYPSVREFRCIGEGGEQTEAFALAMLAAAASCAAPDEPLRREEVQVRPSRTGKYVAVSVFVTVTSFEQVKATYDLMKADKRLRYFL